MLLPNSQSSNHLIRQIKVQTLFLLIALSAHAQTTKEAIQTNINILTSDAMHGRGYVMHGVEQASIFVQRRFREYKLKAVTADGSFIQGYTFPVNTFPGQMALIVDGKVLAPGADFLIDAASTSYTCADKPVKTVDLATITSKGAWRKTLSSFKEHNVYCLENVDSFCKVFSQRQTEFAASLPKGCYIIPQKSKLTWDVSRDTIEATVFYVKKEALTAEIKSATVNVESRFVPKERSENVLACVPGTVKDTFIAITAHYDHLGMMGDATIFPGASDNASGTAMMIYLSSYFATHPQKYSILFIAFSGEEPGLMGSGFYVAHPVVPLAQIKFLANIDIMGDATDGVTVVNATEYPDKFALLNKINDANHYIPVIKSRGKAANSDHYHFSEAGVPSFFLYSNGGKGYYHDIYDKGEETTLANVDGVAKLLIDFVGAIN
jgi:hypothetical protein